jgi:hypothetical protein
VSRLEYYSRPLVAFDAHNKEHRKHYYTFRQTHSWGKCPVRFIVPDESGWDLISMIQRQLLEFYVDREFKIVAKKPQKKVIQKRKKTVDKPNA